MSQFWAFSRYLFNLEIALSLFVSSPVPVQVSSFKVNNQCQCDTCCNVVQRSQLWHFSLYLHIGDLPSSSRPPHDLLVLLWRPGNLLTLLRHFAILHLPTRCSGGLTIRRATYIVAPAQRALDVIRRPAYVVSLSRQPPDAAALSRRPHDPVTLFRGAPKLVALSAWASCDIPPCAAHCQRGDFSLAAYALLTL